MDLRTQCRHPLLQEYHTDSPRQLAYEAPTTIQEHKVLFRQIHTQKTDFLFELLNNMWHIRFA